VGSGKKEKKQKIEEQMSDVRYQEKQEQRSACSKKQPPIAFQPGVLLGILSQFFNGIPKMLF